MSDGVRYERLTDIVKLAVRMQGLRGGVTLDDIQAEFGVGRRTAERMRDAVEGAFAPLETVESDDNKRHWRLRSDALRRLVPLSAEELAELDSAANALERTGFEARAAALRELQIKLRATLHTDTLARIEADIEALVQAEGLAMRAGPRPRLDRDLLARLREAIATCRIIEVRYLAQFTGRMSRQRIAPYGLLYGNRPFLVGRTGWKNQNMRLWRLANMSGAQVTGESFTRDPGFDLEAYARRSFGTFQEEPVDVVLCFSPEAKRDAAFFLFHPNVDLYLSFSRAYAVRGLRAFAEAMTAAWSDEARAVEGRPDAQEDAVALYTMHAAKGLEWPIVVPINTMTQVRATETAVTDRTSGRFYCRVFGAEPTGYAAARDDEGAELDRERVRLWYVATTRARELLVLPRLDVVPRGTAWISLVDLALPSLPALDLDYLPPAVGAGDAAAVNEQTRESFAAEAAGIAARHRRIVWRAPSRDEDAALPVLREEAPTILATDGDGAPADGTAGATIQSGRERGTILHKLIEEVLTGETTETLPALTDHAETLIRALDLPVTDDPAQGLSPVELAGCVVRALALPEVAALRPGLVPELPVYDSTERDGHEEAAAGIVDAIVFDAGGAPQVVIDWKSDVDPSPETLDHYRAQVRAYLNMTGAERGMVVCVTSGTIHSVAPS